MPSFATDQLMTEETAQNRHETTYQEVANFFLAFADDKGEPITNLKLQKLVYYAQAWFLANYGKPLFEGDFQAWVHGPVLPELYHAYKERGAAPIPSPMDLEKVEAQLNPEVIDFLKEVARVYMPSGAYELELMTHQEDPWIEARDGVEADAKCTTVISLQSMQEYYGGKIKN